MNLFILVSSLSFLPECPFFGRCWFAFSSSLTHSLPAYRIIGANVFSKHVLNE